MAIAQRIGWGIAGAATTMVARSVVKRVMHGAPEIPRARRTPDFGRMLALAAAAGALLAVGDLLREQRQRVTEAAAESSPHSHAGSQLDRTVHVHA